MLKQRIITGLVLALVFVGSILYGSTLWVSILFACVLFAATRELLALTLKPREPFASIAAAGFALLFWWSLSAITLPMQYWQALAGLGAWVLIACGLPFYRHSGNWSVLLRVLALGIGLDLLWICVHGLVFLHALGDGGWLLLYAMTLVWVADIGAYFSGRKFGRNKLAPAISPGKTREGLFGGLLLNLAWILGVYSISGGWGLSLVWFVALGLACSLISVVGDLSVSILKREAGVKDSGKLLPGHGGALDRIDSILAAAPVFVAGLFIAGAR